MVEEAGQDGALHECLHANTCRAHVLHAPRISDPACIPATHAYRPDQTLTCNHFVPFGVGGHHLPILCGCVEVTTGRRRDGGRRAVLRS